VCGTEKRSAMATVGAGKRPVRPMSAAPRRKENTAGRILEELHGGLTGVSPPTGGSGGGAKARPRPASALARTSHVEKDFLFRQPLQSSEDADSRASTRPTSAAGYARSRPDSALSLRSRPQSAASIRSAPLIEEGEVDSPASASFASRRFFVKGLFAGSQTIMSHFSVKMAPDPVNTSTGTDYLRIYYSDTFAVPPAEPLIPPNERTVEVETLCEWIRTVQPRTRLDAYPLWVLTKDMLRRFVSQDVSVISGQLRALTDKNRVLEDAQKKALRESRTLEVQLKAAFEKIKLLEAVEAEAAEVRKSLLGAEASLATMAKSTEALNAKLEEQDKLHKKKLEDAKLDARAKIESLWENKMAAVQKQVEAEKKKVETMTTKLTSMEKEHKAVAQKAKQLEKQASAPRDVGKLLEDLDQSKRLLMLSEILQDPKMYAHVRTVGSDGKIACVQKAVLAQVEGLVESGKEDVLRALSGEARVGAVLLAASSSATIAGQEGGSSLIDAILHMAMASHHASGDLSRPDGAENDPEMQGLLQSNGELKERIEQLEEELAALTKGKGENGDASAEGGNASLSSPEGTASFRSSLTARDLDTMRKPKALAVFTINPKFFKGKPVKPQPEQQMLQLIANIYEEKAKADKVDDGVNNLRQTFPEFLRDFMINKFGLKSIALTNLQSLILGVRKGAAVKDADTDTALRLRCFGLISGIIAHVGWHEDLSNIVLHALGMMFRIDKIKENMDHGSNKQLAVDPMAAIDAATDAWTKFCRGPMPLDLTDRLIGLARATDGVLSLHDWIKLLIDFWLQSSEEQHRELLAVFDEHDSNGDGVLDSEEFNRMIFSLRKPPAPHSGDEWERPDERFASKLFTEALEESAYMEPKSVEDDVMVPEAFVRCARKYRLTRE